MGLASVAQGEVLFKTYPHGSSPGPHQMVKAAFQRCQRIFERDEVDGVEAGLPRTRQVSLADFAPLEFSDGIAMASGNAVRFPHLAPRCSGAGMAAAPTGTPGLLAGVVSIWAPEAKLFRSFDSVTFHLLEDARWPQAAPCVGQLCEMLCVKAEEPESVQVVDFFMFSKAPGESDAEFFDAELWGEALGIAEHPALAHIFSPFPARELVAVPPAAGSTHLRNVAGAAGAGPVADAECAAESDLEQSSEEDGSWLCHIWSHMSARVSLSHCKLTTSLI